MAKKNAAPPAPPASLVVYEVPVASLRPAEYNPRLMTEKEANDLRASLREFGFVEPDAMDHVRRPAARIVFLEQ